MFGFRRSTRARFGVSFPVSRWFVLTCWAVVAFALTNPTSHAKPVDDDAEAADEMPDETPPKKASSAKAKSAQGKSAKGKSSDDNSKAKTKKPAKTAAGAPLRYAFQEGQRYVYEIEITLDLGDDTRTINGHSTYTVKRADEDEIVLEHDGRLISHGKTHAGRSRIDPRHRQALTSFPSSFGGSGELTVSTTGKVVKNTSKEQLPYLLGPIAMLIFEPLSADNLTEWEVSNNVAVEGKGSPKPATSPAARMRSPRMRGASQQPQTPAFVSAATEHATYTRGAGKGDLVKIKKHLEFQSQAASAEIPGMGKVSDGEITFDVKAGVPKKATLKEVLQVAAATAPLTVTYRLLSDAEVAKMDKEAADVKAEHEAKVAEEKRPLDDDDVRKLLAELKVTDKRRAAADRLAKGPANDQRDEVAKALGKLLNDREDSTRSVACKALVVWGTADNVPALVKLTETDNGFLRSDAMRALGALKDERGAKAVAKVFPQDKHAAGESLKSMGPVAEPYVVPLLEDRDTGVRIDACKILATIGGEKSRAALEALSKSGRGGDAREAEKTLREIASRE
jgi:hypothetical protein